MARNKKDTANQGAPPSGEPESTDAHAGEHRRASARAPTVPFQMVTRRAKRASGGSEEHAIASNEPASAGEEVDPDFAVENEAEPQGEVCGAVPSADDAGDAPRRSSRVVPKKVAPPAQRSLLLILRLSPAKLESVVGGFSNKSTPPPLSPVSPVVEGPVVQPTEGLAPPPRNKRPRNKKAASPNAEEANAEEERPKKRRKNKKSVEEPALEGPVLPDSAELAAVQQPGPPLPSSAPSPLPPPPTSPTAGAPVLGGEALKAEPPFDDQMEVSQPEEPLQKRRGRPPKSELLKRQRQPRQPVAAPAAPAAHPAGSLALQFREQMPEGMNMLDVVALAQYMRAKDLQAKRRPMKQSIKKGYRVEHRVTREWCTQRAQKLINQQRRIGRHVQRANVALADQAMRLAQHDPTYLSETGLGAPFYRAGLQQAAEQRDKLRDIGNLRNELELQAVDNRIEHTRLRRRRQVRNEIADGLEKLAVERKHLSNVIRTFAAENPDKVDEIVEECEKTGEDISTAILSAACKIHPNEIEDDETVSKIWRSRGHGLGKWFRFVDDNRMDLDDDEEQNEELHEGQGKEGQEQEEELQAILERDEVLAPNQGVVSNEKQQPPMSFERGGSPGFDEREQPPVSNERGGSPAPEEMEKPTLLTGAEEFQLSDERSGPHIDLTKLLEIATQEFQTRSESPPKSPMPEPEIELLDVLATAAAQRDHIPGTPELLLPLSPGPSLHKEPSPAFQEAPSPVFQEGPSPTFSEDEGLAATSASPPPSFGGEGSIDERASNFSNRIMESSAEPGFALSGPAPPPEVLKPSAPYQEVDHGSRFTGETRRWSDNRIFPMDRGSTFSPIATHHHFLPGHSPPPHQSRGSSVHSLPPPTALSSPGRLLPSPVPSTRFPAAYQALPQRSPSPGFFNPLPHDPRYRGDQSR
ncbi:hypothetical protein TWF506_003135 [Arthrobotrys conoides]|uniref:Uncharacterized protein n=1 Tax=Arthrobotrys conoides TaxID=74498 RepID=A0AAN8N8G5_9PEZI